MRCLFCKQGSNDSKSVEHIIPESFGNTTLVLPKGVVCDKCNNYFAKSVEKPFLETSWAKTLRFHQALPSKKGRVPSLGGVILPDAPMVATRWPKHDLTTVAVPAPFFQKIADMKEGKLILLMEGEVPFGPVASRFLSKVALESMALRVCMYDGGVDYLCDHEQLDDLRDHARRGRIADWPVHVRRIYPADARATDSDGKYVQTIHESDFLVTGSSEWFFALALFGVEFVINLGGPEIAGYAQWLNENGQRSPLYVKPGQSELPQAL